MHLIKTDNLALDLVAADLKENYPIQKCFERILHCHRCIYCGSHKIAKRFKLLNILSTCTSDWSFVSKDLYLVIT